MAFQSINVIGNFSIENITVKADNYNTLKNETYQNYVSKAEFNSQIGQLQDKIDNIVAPDLSDYLKKDMADNLYATKDQIDDFTKTIEDLTKRVEALENK